LVKRFVWVAGWLWRLHKQQILSHIIAGNNFKLKGNGTYPFNYLLPTESVEMPVWVSAFDLGCLLVEANSTSRKDKKTLS
jgi:hypothetical protein